MTVTPPEEQLRQAQAVLNDYGRVLAEAEDPTWGLPASRLPHPKDTIKNAIQILLWEVGDTGGGEVSTSLVEAYVFLAQFIPDEDAEILARGRAALASGDPAHPDLECADRAARIVNEIKLEMEALLAEVRIFLRPQAPG